MFGKNNSAADAVSSAVAKRRVRRGIWVSGIFHVVLLTTLLTWYVRRPEGNLAKQPPSPSGSQASSTPAPSVPASEPALKQKKGQKTSDAVSEKLAELTKAAETRSEKANLDELEKNLDKLAKLSTPESIDQITNRFEGWFDISDRGSQEANSSPEGEFDPNTAQILDIRREKNDSGEWEYISIMADAQGRTMEVELDDPGAESTYNTIKRLKSNPLADKLYRQIVMPLFDKMLNDSVDSLVAPPPQILQTMPGSTQGGGSTQGSGSTHGNMD